MQPLLQGLAIGFAIAAPVGPIGVLCIRRALTEGRAAGFVSGLGAATADAVYGLVAALGVTAVTNALLAHQHWFRLGGGGFLLWLGFATLRQRPTPSPTEPTPKINLPAAYASTFALTLTNPLTIVSFMGIFTGIGATYRQASGAVSLVAGVFLGSAMWWLLLSNAAAWFGQHLAASRLRTINLAAGLVIAGAGAWQLAGLLQSLR